MIKIYSWATLLLVMIIMLTSSGTEVYAQSDEIQIISTVTDLRNIKNDLSGNYKLANDINLEGEEWAPIGTTGEPFKGTLDGNGYKVKNINISGTNSYIGLFGSIKGGCVKNLIFENAIISGDSYIGVLTGHIKDGYIIDNCDLTGTITISGSNQYIGGLLGYGYQGTIKNISGEVTVNGSKCVGGLAGYIGMSNLDSITLYGIIQGTGESNAIGGLLGYLYNSQISNSNVEGQISGKEKIGGLIGYGNIATINSCGTRTSITGTKTLGGLIGFLDRGTIKNCNAIGEITGTDYVGGLAGQLINKGKIENCYAEGILIANQFVGGLIGYAEKYPVKNSYTTINITTSGSYVGGLIGFMKETWEAVDLENCFALGQIQSQVSSNYIGGLIGYCQGGQKIKYCYSGIKAEKGTLTNGLVGYGDAIICESSYYDGTASNCNPQNSYGTSKHTQEMRAIKSFKGWDFEQVWSINEGQSYPFLKNMDIPETAISNLPTLIMQGKGTETEPYEIYSLQQLENVRYNLNAYYKLQDDFDLINELWIPIGSSNKPFTGVFNGNGYKISNLKISGNGSYLGLFGFVNNGKVHDLAIENAEIIGEQYVGTLVGFATNDYRIENIVLSGLIKVKGTEYVGGLMGRGYIGDIIKVSADVYVEGTKSVGGLAGSIRSGKIEKCNIKGSVKGTDSQIGGIVGFLSEATLINSYSTASIDGNIKVGGIVGLLGYNGKATIINCYFAASLKGINEVGGISGSSYEGVNNNCYFDSIISGIKKPVDQGKTTDVLMNELTYVDWDFENTWEIEEGIDYPQLIILDVKSMQVSKSTSRSISLKWTAVKNATGYELEIDRNKIVMLGDVTSYTHAELLPGTQHRYRIRAVNSNETSNWSSKLVETTPLDTPTNVVAEFVSGMGINISWDGVEEATGYKVEINGEEILVFGTTYYLQDYTDDTQYIYRIKTLNDISDSLWSEKQSLITWQTNKPGICLTLDNQKTFLGSDEVVSLVLKGHNITDLYTVQLTLTYDPTKLVFTQDQIQDLVFTDSEDPYSYISFDGTKGEIKIIFSLTSDEPGINGDFDILRIEGDMIQSELTQVEVTEIKLVDSDARYIDILEPQNTNIWILSKR